jgi:hypothetical protein
VKKIRAPKNWGSSYFLNRSFEVEVITRIALTLSTHAGAPQEG